MYLPKTVIGSFPFLPLPIEDAIERNLKIQLDHEIDIVTDGEPRASMIEYFIIPGLSKNPRGICVDGRIKTVDDPSQFVKVRDYEYLSGLIRRHGGRVYAKTTITGPVTLGFLCASGGVHYYNNISDPRLYQDLAYALRPFLLKLLDLGSMVQLDEPILTQRVMQVDRAVAFINLMLEGIPENVFSEGRLSIHVCGGLTDTLFEKLLDLNVSNVSLAFSGQDGESNIHIMTKKAVEKTGKKIGVGCGSVMPLNVDEVDSKETIIQRIRAIADRIGYENIAYIHPDCGLRNTPQPVIDILLGNLNAASKEFGSSQ